MSTFNSRVTSCQEWAVLRNFPENVRPGLGFRRMSRSLPDDEGVRKAFGQKNYSGKGLNE